ncbi:MAG: eukaryotic-like serine/threonine-protein kinase [Blastocatellia bacterium]|nr:eukaryotic-like serine/threonine-protein kinase [Blastocatellia bacterium]
MSLKERAASVLGHGAILIGIAVLFVLGMLGTVYLSLRSPEVKVPDVVGKDRADAETTISDAGLNFRVRATRPIGNSKPDTVVLQLPGAGEMVKAGQTVAVDVSRAAKEGESATSVQPEIKPETANSNQNSNQAANDNLNENKPKRPKNTNTNKNANANANGNTNSNRANANGNRNSNANANTNAKPTLNINNRPPAPNANTGAKVNRATNTNRRPPQPRPSPVNRPSP